MYASEGHFATSHPKPHHLHRPVLPMPEASERHGRADRTSSETVSTSIFLEVWRNTKKQSMQQYFSIWSQGPPIPSCWNLVPGRLPSFPQLMYFSTAVWVFDLSLIPQTVFGWPGLWLLMLLARSDSPPAILQARMLRSASVLRWHLKGKRRPQRLRPRPKSKLALSRCRKFRKISNLVLTSLGSWGMEWESPFPKPSHGSSKLAETRVKINHLRSNIFYTLCNFHKQAL